MNGSFPTLRKPKYGWVPDLPDQRDFLYASYAPPSEKMPDHINLCEQCSPIEDQGQLGSCTAQALAGNLEFLKLRQLKKILDLSRLFIYYNERVISHTVEIDSGASLRDGIKTLVKLGVCTELIWPYNINKFSVKPSDKAYDEALDFQITAYYRITSLNQMRQTLATGYPFVFGFSVYESFESEIVAKTGQIPLPEASEHLIGGHAVMAVGYDDLKKQMIIRNSWGITWGDQGYCYMPYDYISNPYLATDFWTIRNME